MVLHFLTRHFLKTEKYTRESAHGLGQVLVYFSDSLVRVQADQQPTLDLPRQEEPLSWSCALCPFSLVKESTEPQDQTCP